MSVDLENPLEEFELEAPALPSRHAAAVLADARRSVAALARPSATIHEIPAAMEGRLSAHVSREAADMRRRLTELKQSIDTALANQNTDVQRLTWVIKFAIYVLLAISMAQFGLIVWTRSR